MRIFVIAIVAMFLAEHNFLSAQEQPPSPFQPLADKDAWQLLPRKNPPLPAWARVLVKPLPKTTGAMLELDYLHRAKNPLGPVLSSKLRWVTAHALGSKYGMSAAEADLRRAGVGDKEFKELAADAPEMLAPKDRAAFRLARKMSLAAYSVTDDEMAELLKLFGPEQTVAIVHTLAYANFHNRIILALGVEVELDGSPPPVDVQMDPAAFAKIVAPKRTPLKEQPDGPASLPAFRLDWSKQGIDDLLGAKEKQKNRKSRIPSVDLSRFDKYPPMIKMQAEKIVWMNVSMGHQPQLTKAWFECLGAFRTEAVLDRVFGNSVFWIVTRSNECFY